MREIKFRAWDGFRMLPWDEFKDSICDHLSDQHDNDYIAVMQYTGLKDMNGVEIYEGDIIQIVYHPLTDRRPSPHTSTGTVLYRDGRFYVSSPEDTDNFLCFYSHNIMPLFRWNESEVIGNIYENPELLGKEG